MCALVRNDVFFFRLLSGAALAHRTRRNAGLRPQARAASNRRRRLLASVDGVPYEIKHVGTPVPGCPPPLGALIRTPREWCPYGKTCRAVGLRPPLAIHGEDRDDRKGRPYAEIAKIAPRREPGGFGVN